MANFLPSLELIQQARAKKRLINFAGYTDRAYRASWHHVALADKLDRVLSGHIQFLMVFMPPQHGKSTLVSQHFPAFGLGQQPDSKFIAASYAATLAQKNNRATQRIMSSPEYARIFPDTSLNDRNIRSVAGAELRNSDEFEIVGHQGAYKCAGVAGQLTGFPCDVGIIDDPYKDYKDAMSEVIRRTVWEWYSSVFLTRCHDRSAQIITLTRWHKLDLAGQLLSLEGRASEGGKWHVLELPALYIGQPDPADPKDTRRPNPDDQRTEINAALWPGRTSTETLIDRRALNPYQFEAIYQQNPQAKTGLKFSRQSVKDLMVESVDDVPLGCDWARWWDMAASEETGAAWTVGILMARHRSGKVYIIDYKAVQYATTRRDRFIKETADDDAKRYGARRVLQLGPQDPAAAGKSAALAFRQNLSGHRVETEIESGDKELRAEPVESAWGGGSIYVVIGPWNDQLFDRLEQWPYGGIDEGDALANVFNKLFARSLKQRQEDEAAAQSHSWGQSNL